MSFNLSLKSASLQHPTHYFLYPNFPFNSHQQARAKCSKCGGKRLDVRPNWKQKPGMPDSWEGRSAWDK